MEAAPAANGEAPPRDSTSSMKLRDFIPIYIPGVESGAIDRGPRKRRFLDFLKAQPSKDWLLRAGIRSRLSTFTYVLRNSVRRRGGGGGGGDPNATGRRFRVPFVRKINWKALLQYGKNWIKHPMNMALCVWLLFVAAGLLTLGLLMIGLLNDAIPKSSQRKRWTEILNQILNALFTIMCLYQHPNLFHHLVILCRWTPKDAVELRTAYCKTSARRPHERAHMAFVILLLHTTCFSQYVLCALYWGWTSKTRPDWAENLCIGLGTGTPVIAALYTVYSPLGRKMDPDLLAAAAAESSSSASATDEESQKPVRVRVVVTEPQWLGGLFDCWDDATVACLSLSCTFCVFGWNMERLGFGNMYVHMVTFVLLCVAPLLVFSVSALNINDDDTKYAVGIIGCVLCFCGLMYGGYWRTQMRKRFKLPPNPLCCGYPAVTDCFQWLFCWACSLAQEVRTGNYYEVEDDSFYRRDLEEEARAALEPLPREGQAGPRAVRSSSDSSNMDRFSPTHDERNEPSAGAGLDRTMSAPAPALIELEDENNQQPKN